MTKLTRIIEQIGTEGQYYDLGRDFSNFRRTMDGSNEQIKQKFENIIGSKLNGKRIRAQASRGYKQYNKTFEFDVTKVTLDDYYDNYVVVARDSTTPNPKEYFLKPGFKIQILGPASGQPSPTPAPKPGGQKPTPPPQPISPKQNPDKAQSQPMALAPPGHTPTEESVKEEPTGLYDAYSIDEISRDIKKWLPKILKKPETTMRDFVKSLGWKKDIDKNTSVALYELKIPEEALSQQISQENIQAKLVSDSQQPVEDVLTKYDVVKMKFDETKEEWQIRIKKTTTRNKGV